jgi:TetR/AcrR family transcriptional repressor of nem operon
MGRSSDASTRLVASAAELLHARGYASVGVDALCKHAGVRKGSFYHFFRSKRAVTLAALDWHWQRTRRAVLERAFCEDRPPLDRLERFFELLADAQAAAKRRTGHVLGCPFGNLAGEMASQDATIRRRVRRVFREIASYIERALREAVATGALPRSDSAADAQALVAYMEGVLLLAGVENDPALVRRLGRRAVWLVAGPRPGGRG